jgi:hypothetical protein
LERREEAVAVIVQTLCGSEADAILYFGCLFNFGDFIFVKLVAGGDALVFHSVGEMFLGGDGVV